MFSFKKVVSAVTVAAVAVVADQSVYKRTDANGLEIAVVRLDDKELAVGNTFQFCPMCVSLMEGGLNYLLNYILNAGVLTSCNELCEGALKKSSNLEQDVCIALCDATGLAAFIKGMEKSEPDPVAACEEIDLCEYVAGGAVKMHAFTATPASVTLGSPVVLTSEFTVTSRTSTGEIRFVVQPKDGAGNNADGVALPTAPGNYKTTLTIPTGVKNSPIQGAGLVDAAFYLCEGQCGDTIWNDAHTYASALTNFTVVNKK